MSEPSQKLRQRPNPKQKHPAGHGPGGVLREIMKKPIGNKRRKQPQYPALDAWQRRERGKPHSQWTYDPLWQAALAEHEARENRHDPGRERHCQIEAVLALLYGKCVGDPQRKRYPKVVLDVNTQRRYVQRIHEFERGAA